MGGHLLVWGGRGQKQLCDPEPFALDWQKREWIPIRAFGTPPTPRFQHIAVAFGNKLYIFGGHDGKGSCYHDMHLLEIDFLNQRATWQLVRQSGAIPRLSGASSSVVIGNRMVVIGGSNAKDFSNDVFMFDPATTFWTQLSPTGTLPRPRAAHTSCVVNGRIFVFGGSNGSLRLNDLHVLDLDATVNGGFTAAWSRFPLIGDAPDGRSLHSMVVDREGNMYMYGGWNGAACFADLFVMTFFTPPPPPPNAASTQLEALFMEETLADVHLICEGHRIPAHKAILYCRSSLFQSWMAFWGNSADIVIPELKYEVLYAILQFAYTGKANYPRELAEEVLLAADKFGLTQLKTLASRELVAGLRIESVERYHELAQLMDLTYLKQASVLFCSLNLQQVREHKIKTFPEVNDEGALLTNTAAATAAVAAISISPSNKRSLDDTTSEAAPKRLAVQPQQAPLLHSPAVPLSVVLHAVGGQ
eukprot:TRINITY_DN3053_c0_g1_i1.p1 TRINITY_DN3053_c0_g1~~TRINITY_DN3053_c0_g1_i1.p1  ORF type:complete len:474 (-),score=80.48 TRINITY_DN3053_c0_g1_i1:16-1437(-)